MADPTITALMHANLYEVFGQRDPALRREAIARTYTDDVAFTDDAGTIVGLAAIGDRVQQLLQGRPRSVRLRLRRAHLRWRRHRRDGLALGTARRRAGRTRSRHRDP